MTSTGAVAEPIDRAPRRQHLEPADHDVDTEDRVGEMPAERLAVDGVHVERRHLRRQLGELVVAAREGRHDREQLLWHRRPVVLALVLACAELPRRRVREDRAGHEIGMTQHELLCDEAAVGVADHDDALVAEVTGEVGGIVSEPLDRHGLETRPARAPVVAMIEVHQPHPGVAGESVERAQVGVVVAEAAVQQEARHAVTDLVVVQVRTVDRRDRHRSSSRRSVGCPFGSRGKRRRTCRTTCRSCSSASSTPSPLAPPSSPPTAA
jgi:hypothetical protein